MLRIIVIIASLICFTANAQVVQQASTFIARLELFEPCAYEDVDGYAVGYGTRRINGKEVQEETCISKTRAKKLLIKHIEKDLILLDEHALRHNVELSVNQKVSLLSFMYNLGSGIIYKSKILQSQDYCKTLLRYIHAGGKIHKGLKYRRQLECKLWKE